ncbi:MAG: hypothetical protein M3Q69_13525, partial [Acidobacteriota bacterium]|nr:hypothetical protein [Acidobacteriota bacterium]
MPAPLPAFGETFAASFDDAARRLTITAASSPLIIAQRNVSGEVVGIPSDYDVVIHADRVVIRGMIEMPGRSFSLYARLVEIENDAAVVTSGRPGALPPPPLASNFPPGGDGGAGGPGQQGGRGGYGRAGAEGAKGARGENGGNITIVAGGFAGVSRLNGRLLLLATNGGAGGRGQDGQSGGPGGRGGRGGDAAGGNPR